MVGVGRGVPLTGYAWTSDFGIDNWAPERFGSDVRHREVTSAYFTALRIPVLQGRLFEDADPADPVTLVSVVVVIGLVALAATVWPTWRAIRVDPVSVLRIE